MRLYGSIADVGTDVGCSIGVLITHHIDHAFRRILPESEVVREDGFLRMVTGEAHPFGNFACITRPADVPTVRAAIAPLEACGAPAAAFLTGPASDGVDRELGSRGFVRHGGMPAMGVEIERLADTPLASGCRFDRITRASDGAAWAEVFARGYGIPHRLGEVFAHAITDDDSPDSTLQYFWVTRDGVPVATSVLFLHQGLAGIYAVATVSEERGRGLGAYVTAEPLRRAHSLGYRVGILQSSDEGHPVYRRIGFREFGEMPLYVRMPA
ncbi:MAG: hypothetical protein KF902_12905 [Phycisphaeraceae bacterium]|nr:hypothetical protein [Phycisphaeraceae bacterium]